MHTTPTRLTFMLLMHSLTLLTKTIYASSQLPLLLFLLVPPPLRVKAWLGYHCALQRARLLHFHIHCSDSSPYSRSKGEQQHTPSHQARLTLYTTPHAMHTDEAATRDMALATAATAAATAATAASNAASSLLPFSGGLLPCSNIYY